MYSSPSAGRSSIYALHASPQPRRSHGSAIPAGFGAPAVNVPTSYPVQFSQTFYR
jgi:hypothetical protein